MPDPNPATPVLCEPAQLKRTWTFHKNHFVWKFTRKMPDPVETTSIERQALTPTVKTPQCGHTVWGTAFCARMQVKAVSYAAPHETVPNGTNYQQHFTSFGFESQQCERSGY